jgi:hypothetical protein
MLLTRGAWFELCSNGHLSDRKGCYDDGAHGNGERGIATVHGTLSVEEVARIAQTNLRGDSAAAEAER